MHSLRKKSAVFQKTKGLCFYCGQIAVGIDHILPQIKGGRHNIENLVPACKSCNSLKGDLLIENFRSKIRSMIKMTRFHWLFYTQHGIAEIVESVLSNKPLVFWGERNLK